MNRQHNSKYIFLILHLLCCIFLCQCSNNNQSKDNDRSDYVQRAREQDSLRIAHYQDSVEKAKLAAIAQKEKEEADRAKAEQERKKQEEAKRAEEQLLLESKIKPSGKTRKGKEWVDLGLSVLWATYNVDATSPSDYGGYYAWGETNEKTSYTTENCLTYEKDIREFSGNTAYDVASAKWGEDWRMPTGHEMKELKNKCIWKWVSYKGHKGYIVEGPNGNCIFLPAAGSYIDSEIPKPGKECFYRTSSPDEDSKQGAYSLSAHPENFGSVWTLWAYCRRVGGSVRAVRSFSYDDLVSDEAKNSSPTFGLR